MKIHYGFVLVCVAMLGLAACGNQLDVNEVDSNAVFDDGPTDGQMDHNDALLVDDELEPQIPDEAPVVVAAEDLPDVMGVEMPASEGVPNVLSSALFPGELRVVLQENSQTTTLQLSAADAVAFLRDMDIGAYIKQSTGTLNPFSATDSDFIRLTSMSMGSNTLYIYKDYSEAVFSGFDYGPGELHYYTMPEDAYKQIQSLATAYASRNTYKPPADGPIALEG